ncbi:hypothetical protein MRS44_013398 [Fusarium solani]|uniref:uncharacterized protein n=1 Tax=Fusarium solani TaxID=169388 RepID=UPI0032C456A2|nr:hypothetical protein MRS44_013398 [Fusarium solani]
MAPFHSLIRFESAIDGQTYFADVGIGGIESARPGLQLEGYVSIEDLIARNGGEPVTVGKLGAQLVTEHPPLWTKPAASLANPDEDITISKFCAAILPDYEGELVFVTSRDCRDVGPDEAESYILGYTIGNDISCRLFQLPEKSGGQFFFAEAFDKFAPIS